MGKLKILQELAGKHGTPLIVVDHEVLRRNYGEFQRNLPRIQIYYAVKANPDPAILETFYKLGASFDVASLSEFLLVHKNIEHLPEAERQKFIWGKIIYANPIKAIETLKELDRYKPLVTYDNPEEVQKVHRYAPHAGLVLRIKVPNTGAVVELSSKFGAPPAEAARLIRLAHKCGLSVEGISFHVGSQNTNYANYVNALHLADGILKEAWMQGFDKLKILDIGGGFPAPYDPSVRPFEELAAMLNAEFDRLFPDKVDLAAEPGRYLVATAVTVVASVIGRTQRGNKPSYYLDDGVYQTFSGIVFDRCKYHVKAFKQGQPRISAVYGPTCDSLDTISLSESLPELNIGDLVYAENIGAYSYATATHFNGFRPAKVVHINR
jgi:ornithine decarboxylase